VAVTALAMVGDRERGLAVGFDGYIFKPINPQVFAEQMSTFLRLGKEVKLLAMKPSQRSMIPKPAKRRVILSVDDQAVNVKLMECLFEPHGYTVTTAGGLSHALAVARQHRPDLILSDVKMLEGNGLDLCRAIKADPELKDIPVVLITSTFCDEKSRKQGLALGAEKFLFRPIDPAVLLAEIEACLDKKET
jgi:two-component system cell cycle response regulator